MHTVAAPNTWLVDVTFFGRFAYYTFINVNTRYLVMIPANSRINEETGYVELFATAKESTGIEHYSEALYQFEALDLPVTLLRGDGEKAFATRDLRVQFLYQRMGCRFEPVKRLRLNTRRRANTEPYHSSLAIIDVVTRTIRDMLDNVGYTDEANPYVIGELVKQYNNAPHATLTKYGPGFDISPLMAQRERDIENAICRRLTQANIVTKTADEFAVPIGSTVLVYNDVSPMDKRRGSARPELFTVTAFDRGVYQVKGNVSGVVVNAPRFKLKVQKRPA
jgi:hypothetical protein